MWQSTLIILVRTGIPHFRIKYGRSITILVGKGYKIDTINQTVNRIIELIGNKFKYMILLLTYSTQISAESIDRRFPFKYFFGYIWNTLFCYIYSIYIYLVNVNFKQYFGPIWNKGLNFAYSLIQQELHPLNSAYNNLTKRHTPKIDHAIQNLTVHHF